MRLHSSGLFVALLSFVAATSGAAAHGQTDIALSGYGAFSGTTTGNAVKEIPSNAAGGMVELRHIVNSVTGFEATYALNRANQVYYAPLYCSLCAPVPVSANAHEVTGDWVFSSHGAKVRPFALIGAGVLYFQPLVSVVYNRSAATQSATTPVYVYGAGVDWGILPRLGLRLQYRGNLYNAPDLTLVYGTGSGPGHNGTVFAHTAEPAIGVYYRF
jgi:opacity protein-like surface antigen